MQLLEGLRPTSGNLAPEESWRRMIGGRKRYNHERQQTARARRDAILIWLMENRMYARTKLGYLGTDRIVVQHGDGVLLAKALGVGKATVCRDLSALQATQPALFGSRHLDIGYEEYMAFWRYAHRHGLGNEQPVHNLRFPRTQRGPAARIRRNVERALGRDVYAPQPANSPASGDVGTESDQKSTDASPTTAEFLAMLDRNCPPQTPRHPCIRIRQRLRTSSAV